IRVRQLLETVSRPLPLELEKMKELQSHQMNISFARLEAEALTKSGVKVDNAQIQAKLQDVDFLKKAEEYFQAYKADWSSPETVTAQHLLITFKPGDAQSEKEALAKIQDL